MPDIKEDYEAVKDYTIGELFEFVDDFYKTSSKSKSKAWQFMAVRMFVEVSAAIHEFARSKNASN